MSERILIIEDETAIQSILVALLTDAGYTTEIAGDGLEGITKFREKPFSLVLLDILMPKIDGYTVCEMIRRESNVPVIMLTALDEEEAQIKAFELQADDYITKPFSVKLVLMRVEAVLRPGKRAGRAEKRFHTLLWKHPAGSGRPLCFRRRKARFPHAYGIWAAGAVHAPSWPGVYAGQFAQPRMGL